MPAGTRTVTVLFTDLVGSTALATSLGPAVAELVRQAHFATLRAAVAATGGVEVKTLGDGMMVVYDSASAGLDGSVAIQQSVAAYNRSSEVELAIRVGLSFGEVDQEADDFFGEPVVQAARLCDAAEGGQILAADVVRVLAGRRTVHELLPIGALELKGLPEPVETVEVRWAAVDEEAGAARLPLPARLDERQGLSGFVGRTEELTLLADALKDASALRERRLVLIGGEPGIGKTTVARVFAQMAHTMGSVVLYGRCDEDLGIPYQPWAEAVGHLVEHSPAGLLDEVLAAHGVDLARLGPGLEHVARGAGGGSSDPETARYLLFGAVLRILEVAGADHPVVLVLDDLQWADAQSLQMLRHLVGSDVPLPVVVVATFRESDVSVDHPLADVLAWSHRQLGTTRLSLRGLGDVELLALMEAGAGHPLGEDGLALRDALARETDGNPFFVGELLRHLAETGAVYQDADGRWTAGGEVRDRGLPVSVREVIGRRVARLGDEAVRALSVAAVIGRDFDLKVLASAVGSSEDAVLDVLDAATAATLVVNVAVDRFSFVHALVEHALYDTLSMTRRARAHRRVAEAIEGVYGTDLGPRVGELAYHYAQATTPSDASKAVAYAQAAGDRALAQLAPAEAMRWYEQAINLLDRQHGDEHFRGRLLVGLGQAQRQCGDGRFRATLLSAGSFAQKAGDTDTLVAATLANSRGWFSFVLHVDTDRIAMIDAALLAVGTDDSPERARLLGLLAMERAWDGDYPSRRAIADSALAMARRVGDSLTLLDVLVRRPYAIWAFGSLTERQAIAEEAEVLAGQLGDPVVRFWTAYNRMTCALEAADLDTMIKYVNTQTALADEVGEPILQWNSALVESRLALIVGDTERAESFAEMSFEIGNAAGQPDALTMYLAAIGPVRWHQGRVGELLDLTESHTAANWDRIGIRAGLARYYIDVGRYEEASDLLAGAADVGFADGDDVLRLTGLVFWAETASHLKDAVAAEIIYGQLARVPEQISGPPAAFYGAAAHYLGHLATVLGRYDAAEEHFTQALVIHERLKAPFHIARTHLEWGRMLIARGQPGDAQAARAHLDTGADLAQRYGCALVERRTAELLSQL